VLTALMGLMSDLTSIHFAVLIPMICFVVIAFYAGFADKRLRSE
jgi:MFS transporter, FHS family, L-fucose permease